PDVLKNVSFDQRALAVLMLVQVLDHWPARGWLGGGHPLRRLKHVVPAHLEVGGGIYRPSSIRPGSPSDFNRFCGSLHEVIDKLVGPPASVEHCSRSGGDGLSVTTGANATRTVEIVQVAIDDRYVIALIEIKATPGFGEVCVVLREGSRRRVRLNPMAPHLIENYMVALSKRDQIADRGTRYRLPGYLYSDKAVMISIGCGQVDGP